MNFSTFHSQALSQTLFPCVPSFENESVSVLQEQVVLQLSWKMYCPAFKRRHTFQSFAQFSENFVTGFETLAAFSKAFNYGCNFLLRCFKFRVV